MLQLFHRFRASISRLWLGGINLRNPRQAIPDEGSGGRGMAVSICYISVFEGDSAAPMHLEVCIRDSELPDLNLRQLAIS